MAEGSSKEHKWSDTDLVNAVAIASTSRTYRALVKAHAVRLGLDLSHLDDNAQTANQPPNPKPALANLRDAATMLASSWFSLCGFATAIPVEPTIHDLLVSMPDGIKRVQVKTTTYSGKSGWQVGVGRRPYSAGNREGLVPYDPDLIDCFFIVDGDLTMYLIPSQVIAGRVQIQLRTYARYIVGSAAGFMTLSPPRSGPALWGSLRRSRTRTPESRHLRALVLTINMPVQGDYEPSAQAWVRDQVELFESSGGTRGTTLRDTGIPIVVVTNLGVSSGKVRKTPVMRVEHDGRYAMVASKGGAPEHPQWYYNLRAHPLVELQDGPVKQDMTVREVSGAERDEWWQRAVAVYPSYADYQLKTSREIPVFVLEPATES